METFLLDKCESKALYVLLYFIMDTSGNLLLTFHFIFGRTTPLYFPAPIS